MQLMIVWSSLNNVENEVLKVLLRNDSDEFGFGILAAGLSFAIENIEALIKTLISQFHYTIIIIITKEECGNHQQTETIQGSTCNPVEHLRWSFFYKAVND